MLGRLLTLGLALILLAGVPVLSYLTARNPQLRTMARMDLYFSAVLSQWLLAAMAVPAIWLGGPGFTAIGLRRTSLGDFSIWAVGLAVASLVGLGLVVFAERAGWWPEESDLVHLLLPSDRQEKLVAVCVVAPTAAVCEEFLYRGYLFNQLAKSLDSILWALLLAAAAFGLAHAYQGFHGVVRTALLGALLTVPVIRTGSLYPSMAAHFVIDAVALVWLGPRFLKSEQRDAPK